MTDKESCDLVAMLLSLLANEIITKEECRGAVLKVPAFDIIKAAQKKNIEAQHSASVASKRGTANNAMVPCPHWIDKGCCEPVRCCGDVPCLMPVPAQHQ